MRPTLSNLIIVGTGAFFYWTTSGYKGKFNDYMSRYYDSDTMSDKNFWTGLVILFFVVMITLSLLKKYSQ